ncbi:hypothetical protein [Paenibacillus sp. NEAU-GSW1]|uniref:hypothetical protein n=1 Tax=Paenibacillus sp. NEAU-GSW1 TaxID=2682486 RepID=UPI0012E22257|nr:hypothetical protein [Paenibacillus sp. NEAU-GSW1]MUT67820.1 hypothetical protein [Paenibacillus sp. NEAU-GSW1]
MASNTPNLGLLKKDPAIDGNDTFNIETMLNENWDKIDVALGDGNISDAKIGTRTIDDNVPAAAGADTPARLWSKLGNVLKGLMGTANWYTLPSMTISSIITLLGTLAPKASPALTGTPTAPTAATGTNTTQIANAAFVQAALSGANNQSVTKIKAAQLKTDTRTTTLTYTNGVLTGVVESDGGTPVKTTTLNYTSGILTSVVEAAGGTTVTTTLSYTSGTLTGVSKAVS